jgi:hypothetical protein
LTRLCSLEVAQEGVSGSLKSKLRDTYQRNFIHMTALAACKLFCAAVPRSAPLFDEQFMAAVMQQLRIWTSGLLPADSNQARKALQGPSISLGNNKASRVREAPWKSLRRGEAQDASLLQDGIIAAEDSELPQLRGKAAQGGFDIAKTSPFVTHFLKHHGLQPNDLSRGLLGRHVCAAIKRGEIANSSVEGDESEIESCATFAREPFAEAAKARQSYRKQAKETVAATDRQRRRLQHDVRDILRKGEQVIKAASPPAAPG